MFLSPTVDVNGHYETDVYSYIIIEMIKNNFLNNIYKNIWHDNRNGEKCVVWKHINKSKRKYLTNEQKYINENIRSKLNY